MLVYRVEHYAEKTGPYRTIPVVRLDVYPKRHPLFYHGEYDDAPWLYGFGSMDSLLHWFHKSELVQCFEQAFVVRVYGCPSEYVRTSQDGRQLVFSGQKARCVGWFSCIEDVIGYAGASVPAEFYRVPRPATRKKCTRIPNVFDTDDNGGILPEPTVQRQCTLAHVAEYFLGAPDNARIPC